MSQTDGGARCFRTKTGVAQVSHDALRVERVGARGAMAEKVQGSSTARTWLVYAIFCLLLGYWALQQWQRGSSVLALVAGAMLLWTVASLVRARNFSMAPVVMRSATKRVQAVKGLPGLTRDRVLIHFNEEGSPRCRYLLMPGVLQKGKNEIERAMAIFKDCGWPVDPS